MGCPYKPWMILSCSDWVFLPPEENSCGSQRPGEESLTEQNLLKFLQFKNYFWTYFVRVGQTNCKVSYSKLRGKVCTTKLTVDNCWRDINISSPPGPTYSCSFLISWCSDWLISSSSHLPPNSSPPGFPGWSRSPSSPSSTPSSLERTSSPTSCQVHSNVYKIVSLFEFYKCSSTMCNRQVLETLLTATVTGAPSQWPSCSTPSSWKGGWALPTG